MSRLLLFKQAKAYDCLDDGIDFVTSKFCFVATVDESVVTIDIGGLLKAPEMSRNI